MSKPTSHADSPSVSGPARRKRRLIPRIAGVLFLLLLLLVAGHFIWATVAQRKLTRLVEQYRAQGEPMLPADFERPPLPDADNAVVDLRAAAAALIPFNDPRADAFRELDYDGQPDDEDWKVIRDYVEANPTALANVDAAMAKAGVDWHLNRQTPILIAPLPDLTPQRQLAQLLAADALVAHHTGDDARALHRLRQVLFIGRAVDRIPSLVAHLVSLGTASLACGQLEQITPTLKVTNAAPANPGGGPAVPAVPAGREATPEQVKALIADLLAFEADNAGITLAMRGERMMELDVAAGLLDGKIKGGGAFAGGASGSSASPASEAVTLYAMKPILLGDARHMAEYMSQVVAATGAPDWPTWASRRPPFPKDFEEKHAMHPLAAVLIPSDNRSMLQQYRGKAECRMAATGLALRLYAARHDGRLPAALAELVPEELSTVPADPFTAGRPLSYFDGAPGSKTHAGDPVLYSVNEDGADDGGSDEMPPRFKRFGERGRWERKDAVLHLNPPAPTDPKVKRKPRDLRPPPWPPFAPVAPRPPAPATAPSAEGPR